MRFFVLLAALLQTQPAPNPASPVATDIYLLPVRDGLASLKSAKPAPVSTTPGYDNQPNFSTDGNRILFAANRDGKQTDIFVFDRRNGRITQLTRTAENENSPTCVPAGAGPSGSFTVVQSELDKNGARPASPIQRLWRFNADGASPALILRDINPVGYHAWIDRDRLVLFVLGAQGKPATLQIASVKTGKADVILEGVGRSLHRIPTVAGATAGKDGTRLASFVHREGDTYTVKQIDIDSKKIVSLIKAAEGSGDRDMAWMPDGKTILMSAGMKILAWHQGESGWSEVFDAAAHQLGAITRIAVAPKGDAVAIVVAEPKK